MMESYTFGSEEGIRAVLDELPDRYPMELNREDMAALIEGLAWIYNAALADLDNGEDGETTYDRCHSLLSGIVETLGVDWV